MSGGIFINMDKKETLKIIGKICKKHREQLKVSQKLIAKVCNIPQPSISKFENGKNDSAYILLTYMELFSIDLLKNFRDTNV